MCAVIARSNRYADRRDADRVDRDENLVATDWAEYEERTRAWLRRQYGESGSKLEPARQPNGLTRAIRSYFAGELTAIDTWRQMLRHPFSARCGARCARSLWHDDLVRGTRQTIGRPSAVRAVGLANGSNPVGVVCGQRIG